LIRRGLSGGCLSGGCLLGGSTLCSQLRCGTLRCDAGGSYPSRLLSGHSLVMSSLSRQGLSGRGIGGRLSIHVSRRLGGSKLLLLLATGGHWLVCRWRLRKHRTEKHE
jgi:hypothetical protein